MYLQLNEFKLHRGKVDWHVTKCVIISHRPTTNEEYREVH